MKPTKIALSIAALLASTSILAEEAATAAVPEYTLLDAIKGGKNLTSFRLRYENVDQDGLQPAPSTTDLKEGKAFTLRSLVGWQTSPFHNLSFGVQIIDVSKLKDDFNDSTISSAPITSATNQPNKTQYAKIVDPDYTGVNQLYIDWTGIKNTKVRIGRQQVNLDNVRFVGDIGFRQVMQVFDGVSAFNKSIPDTEVYLAHFAAVRQITTVTRTDGHLDVANIKYRISPSESITGYGYLSTFSDLGLGRAWFGNTAAGAAANQGNKTFGLRLDGVHKIDDDWKALYTAEYAKQTDYSGGDDRIDAHYYKVGGGAMYGNLSLRVDQEMLSSNDSQYAFQTPFGTNHLFQGWVDKFLATPKAGIKDTFVTASYKWDALNLMAEYHVLKSDEDFNVVGGGFGDSYGKEFNVSAMYAFTKEISAKIEYGKYTEDDHFAAAAAADTVAGNRGRIRDTEKLWLTAMYTF